MLVTQDPSNFQYSKHDEPRTVYVKRKWDGDNYLDGSNLRFVELHLAAHQSQSYEFQEPATWHLASIAT